METIIRKKKSLLCETIQDVLLEKKTAAFYFLVLSDMWDFFNIR